MREEVIERIREKKIIAIVRGIYGEACVELARALQKGGVELMEVTFDQKSAAERERTVKTVRALNAVLGEKMCFGAGTVTTVEMVLQAKSAGAKFIVSPNTDREVIAATVQNGMVSIPGALTPTEIYSANEFGADFIKVFPACNMGPSYFKNVHAPLSNCHLLAVGGVNGDNARAYLDAGAEGMGVASCLFKKEWVQAGEWEKVVAATSAFVASLN